MLPNKRQMEVYDTLECDESLGMDFVPTQPDRHLSGNAHRQSQSRLFPERQSRFQINTLSRAQGRNGGRTVTISDDAGGAMANNYYELTEKKPMSSFINSNMRSRSQNQ